MQLYAITSRNLFASREALLDRVGVWASSGVDYVQIREKDLDPAELGALAGEIVRCVEENGGRTRVLLNGPAEIAIATGCHGVHLPASAPANAVVAARRVWAGVSSEPIISVSCHTLAEIENARDQGTTLALFAPVFEKRVDEDIIPGQGLTALAEACRVADPMPVFALGGVAALNARDCVEAGAAGIAAIRLFMTEDWSDLRWRVLND